MEACKSELVDYQETNQVGIDAFTKIIQGFLAKME